ncbi:hypothetical protein [Nocardioides sp. Soil805]|uniref:hypothetical protein n=1 Tax=Nocardioides sp. Soil805 TaxID=1736416 RepID=UPI0007030114|nr:hypothetical protein [Nocardioides sp. Soil805]KRF34735.1 hypothetical protein ASG94_11220 [Nocardioides sp. Soil805]
MTHRHPSRRDADRIVDAPAESDLPVGRALEALRAPGGAGELLREDAAVAAFHAARLSTPARAARAASPSPVSRAAALRAVAATGLVVALTSGGFALAATGHLPDLPDLASGTATTVAAERTASPGGTETPTAPGTTGTGTTGTGTTAPDSTAPETSAPESSAPGSGADSEGATAEPDETATEGGTTAPAPTPELKGLCTAFQAGAASAHGKALDSAAFTVLVTAAGGKEAVAAYCVTLVGEPKATGKPSAPPSTKATAKPTGKPSAKPTPTTKPTPAAPTGKPATVPSPTGQGKPSGAGKPGTPAGTGQPETAGKH